MKPRLCPSCKRSFPPNGPCRHCAKAKPVAPQVVAPTLPTTGEMLAKIALNKREKEAQRGRERRKKQREQIAAVKQRLQMPPDELKRLAEEKKQEERQLTVKKLFDKLKRAPTDKEIEDALNKLTNLKVIDSMNRGAFMTDAPHGKGLIVTGGNMEGILKAKQRAEAHGPEMTADDDDVWPDDDKRRVQPEGAGSDQDEVSQDNPGDSPNDGPKSNPGGWVKLGDVDLGQALINLRHTLFAEGICRVCLEVVHDGTLAQEKHLEEAHEWVVAREVRAIKRKRRGRSK